MLMGVKCASCLPALSHPFLVEYLKVNLNETNLKFLAVSTGFLSLVVLQM